MKPTIGALTQDTTLVALLKVIHEVSVTPNGTDVMSIEYTISLGLQYAESSVKAVNVVDAKAAPS